MSKDDNHSWLDDEANKWDPFHTDDFIYGNNDGYTSFDEASLAESMRQHDAEERRRADQDYWDRRLQEDEEEAEEDEDYDIDDYDENDYDSYEEEDEDVRHIKIVASVDFNFDADLGFLSEGDMFVKALTVHFAPVAELFGTDSTEDIEDVFRIIGRSDSALALECSAWLADVFTPGNLKKCSLDDEQYEEYLYQVKVQHLSWAIYHSTYMRELTATTYKLLSTKYVDFVKSAICDIQWPRHKVELMESIANIYVSNYDYDGFIALYQLFREKQKGQYTLNDLTGILGAAGLRWDRKDVSSIDALNFCIKELEGKIGVGEYLDDFLQIKEDMGYGKEAKQTDEPPLGKYTWQELHGSFIKDGYEEFFIDDKILPPEVAYFFQLSRTLTTWFMELARYCHQLDDKLIIRVGGNKYIGVAHPAEPCIWYVSDKGKVVIKFPPEYQLYPFEKAHLEKYKQMAKDRIHKS